MGIEKIARINGLTYEVYGGGIFIHVILRVPHLGKWSVRQRTWFGDLDFEGELHECFDYLDDQLRYTPSD